MTLFARGAIVLSAFAILVGTGNMPAFGQTLFFDDFENRVQDQPLIGNNWTWYDMTFAGDTCEGDPIAEFGPFSDGDGSDYAAENRNYYTASEDVGQGDSYYRAGLEVPAWEGALSNMLRVYGNQFNPAMSCQRTLIFQDIDIENAGTHVFSFDVAQDQFGAPANGEIVAAFVKILRQSDESFEELVFERLILDPPVATTPLDVETASMAIEFHIGEEHIGELLQIGFYSDLTPSLGQAWDTSGAYYDNVRLEPMNIGPAHSGSFFNLGQNGHGFSVEFGEFADGTPVAVIYWYTYDNLGNNVFLIGLGTPVGNSVVVEFRSSLGMQYGVWNAVPNEDQVVAGTGIFEFIDRDNAVFSYTPNQYAGDTFGHTTPVENLSLIKLIGIPAEKKFTNPVLP